MMPVWIAMAAFLMAGRGSAATLRPPIISYSPATCVFILGQPIAAIQPVSSGGKVSQWTISPHVPAGLAFSGLTGAITGTPSALSSSQAYTVKASNASGTAKATLTLSVKALAPSISYSPSSYTLTLGVPAPAFTPASTGGAVVS